MKTIFKTLIGSTVLTLSAQMVLADDERAEEDPRVEEIADIIYNGTGCPNDTGSAVLSDDGTSVELNFDGFAASSGDSISMLEMRKNCQVALSLKLPEGLTYAVSSVDIDYAADIDESAMAYVKVLHYIQGQASQVALTYPIVGPTAEDGSAVLETPEELLQFAPCDQQRALNVNLSALARSTDGQLALVAVKPVRLNLVFASCEAVQESVIASRR